MLLELGKPEEAIREYENSLRSSPGRFNAFAGIARAAKQLGDRVRLESAYTKLAELCKRADTERPELKEAKAFRE
jgi:predicted Zn-dependent protease